MYDEVYRVLSKLRWQPTIKAINPYYDNKFHIQTISQQIRNYLQATDSYPHIILFLSTAYQRNILIKVIPTIAIVTNLSLGQRNLQNEYPDIDFELSFQSRFGPKKMVRTIYNCQTRRICKAK